MSKKKSVTDFQFGSRIGEGSYSTVYKGVDVQTRKVFAIKVLSKKHIVKEKKIKYVNIEKITLNRLGRHPGIVTLYYTFQDENSLYFVIDLAEHGELLTMIRKMGSLSENCSKYYMTQLVDAVDFMHKKGVIHRDLKPENILVNSERKLMITDFGAAKVLNLDDKGEIIEDETTEEAFAKGSFVGTAEYVSPELLKFNKCGFESDIWAIGCILYQFIVGVPPFKGKTEYQTFEKIVGLQYQWPNFFIPELLKDLVFKLLQSDPKDRLSMKSLQSHPWFNRLNWNDKAKIWGVGPPNIEPYRPLVEQTLNQNTSNMNKMVIQKKLPAATVKKNLLNSTISQIRNEGNSNFLFNGVNDKPRQSPVRGQIPLQPITTNDSPIRRQQQQPPQLITNQMTSPHTHRIQAPTTTPPVNRPVQQSSQQQNQSQIRQPPIGSYDSPNGKSIVLSAPPPLKQSNSSSNSFGNSNSAQPLNQQSPFKPIAVESPPQHLFQKLLQQESEEQQQLLHKEMLDTRNDELPPPALPMKPDPVKIDPKALAPPPSIIPKSQMKSQQKPKTITKQPTQPKQPTNNVKNTLPAPPPPVQQQPIINKNNNAISSKPINAPNPAPSHAPAPIAKNPLKLSNKLQTSKPNPQKSSAPLRIQPPKVQMPKPKPPKAQPPKAQPPKAQPPKVQPPKVQPPKIQPPKIQTQLNPKTPIPSPKLSSVVKMPSPVVKSPATRSVAKTVVSKLQSPKPKPIISPKPSYSKINTNIPSEVSKILQNDENVIKLDYINEAELVYSKLKTFDPTSSLSKLSEASIGLDDVLIDEIIKRNGFILEHDLKRIVLAITDHGYLHLFKIESLDELKFYFSIDLTDKLFAMYDYEFSEYNESGYLILEVLKMDKLIFLSPLSKQVKRDLKEFSKIALGSNISWIDSLLKTKQLLKNKTQKKPIQQSPAQLPKSSPVPSSGTPSISSTSTRNTTPLQSSKTTSNGSKRQVKPRTKQEIIQQNRKFAGGAAAAAFNAATK